MNRPLIIALHGVGATAPDLQAALAPLTRIADVIALDGTEPFDGGGRGRQWFSVHGVTEADRATRVAEALPVLLDRLDRVARDRGIERKDLVLLGFSQGSIVTLAMVAQGLHPGRAIALAGRLAAPVLPAGERPASLLLVGDSADQVMPPPLSAHAAEQLRGAGHSVELKLTHGNGHSIGPNTLQVIANWLAATAPHNVPAPAAVPAIEG
jgi:phospholipase/carboxylesterase